MKYDRTQTGNPHKLSIFQHTFPKASIERFTDVSNTVSLRRHGCDKIIKLLPKDKIFCAPRIWNEAIEKGQMCNIERKFQSLATKISEGMRELSEDDFVKISLFYVLCKLRSEFRDSPPENLKIPPNVPELNLDKDSQEIIEKNGYYFIRGNLFSSRDFASIQIMARLGREIPMDTKWGVIHSRRIEFVVPDSFREIGIVPLTPNICIVANVCNGEISEQNAIDINSLALEKSKLYLFANDFKKIGLKF